MTITNQGDLCRPDYLFYGDGLWLRLLTGIDPLADHGPQFGANHGTDHGQDHRNQLKPGLRPEQHGHQHIEADNPEYQPEPATDLLASGFAFYCHLTTPLSVPYRFYVSDAPVFAGAMPEKWLRCARERHQASPPVNRPPR